MLTIKSEGGCCSVRDIGKLDVFNVLSLLFVCFLSNLIPVYADTSQKPEIVAQGFDISEGRRGLLGNFPRIRVRVEVPEGIKELRIKERSYEVDLATTLDRSHLGLFGLEKRARRYRDLTLNFQNYLNDKIDAVGAYTFEIIVVDENDQSAMGKLMIVATSYRPEDAVETGTFRLERLGSGPVKGEPDFGITWKTIDGSNVAIRITIKQPGAAGLGRLPGSAYKKIETKQMLERMVENREAMEAIEIRAASNSAFGEVIALEYQNKKYILRIRESRTERSEFGTNVTLIGEYKH